MNDLSTQAQRTASEDDIMARVGHPKGTLAVVLVYAALFAVGWIAFFFFGFLPRGAPHP